MEGGWSHQPVIGVFIMNESIRGCDYISEYSIFPFFYSTYFWPHNIHFKCLELNCLYEKNFCIMNIIIGNIPIICSFIWNSISKQKNTTSQSWIWWKWFPTPFSIYSKGFICLSWQLSQSSLSSISVILYTTAFQWCTWCIPGITYYSAVWFPISPIKGRWWNCVAETFRSRCSLLRVSVRLCTTTFHLNVRRLQSFVTEIRFEVPSFAVRPSSPEQSRDAFLQLLKRLLNTAKKDERSKVVSVAVIVDSSLSKEWLAAASRGRIYPGQAQVIFALAAHNNNNNNNIRS